MRLSHKRRLRKAIRDLEDKMVNQLAHLDVSKGGKLEGVKINLKQTQKIHARMVKLFDEEYGQTVGRIVREYGQIATQIKSSWRHLGEAVHFTDIDKAMLTSLQSQSYDQFAAFGEAAQTRMADAMYSSVVAGASYSQLVKTIQGILRGHKDVRGRPMTAYADTHAFDAVMNFHNDVNIKKSEDLGIKKFMYVGDVITTTRPFCRRRAGKLYTRAQIESWNRLTWAGKSGPPLTHRGGYNCRHHWRGVRDEWMDEGEFGKTTDDELYAEMRAGEFTDIDRALTHKEALKRKYDASLATTKKLRAERVKLKASGLKATSNARIKEIRKSLIAEEGARRDLKSGIVKVKGDIGKQGAKIKKDIVKGVEPKTLTKRELHPPKAVKRTGSVLERSGIDSIVDSGTKKYGHFQHDVVDPIKKETDRMLDFGGGQLRGMLTDSKRLTINAYNDIHLPGDTGTWAIHGIYKGGGRIDIASSWNAMLVEKEGTLKLGGWQINDTVKGTYRHEYGHHVHKVLLNKKQTKSWDKLCDVEDEQWWADEVSEYASTSNREAFAESFSAYMHPQYKRGMLPISVEKWFDDLFKIKREKIIRNVGVKDLPTIPSSWETLVHRNKTKTMKKWAKIRGMGLNHYVRAVNDRINELVGKSDVYVRITVKNLKDVLRDGRFKSQFETQQSGGLLNNHARSAFESKTMGIPITVDNTKRPIYGYLSEGPVGPSDVSQYGNARVKLKDSVKQRTTFTVGDTLDSTHGGRYPSFQVTPVKRPSYLADRTMEDPSVEYFKKGWDHDALQYKSVNETKYAPYWETQIHGGVNVEDIEKVIFSGDPNKATRDLLKEFGIEWEAKW